MRAKLVAGRIRGRAGGAAPQPFAGGCCRELTRLRARDVLLRSCLLCGVRIWTIMLGSLCPAGPQGRQWQSPGARFRAARRSRRIRGALPESRADAWSPRRRRGRGFPGQGEHPCGILRDQPRCTMSRVCQVTGKRTTTGNNVSHAMNKTRRRFLPNLHERRFWVASENRWVKLRVSTKGLRTIDKNGIDVVLADLRRRGEKI